jgi:hypothetical protein
MQETANPLAWAGGITGVEDWQARAWQLLSDYEFTVLNPRRAAFPLHDPDAHAEQVAWEHRHLQRADVILFWFAASSSSDQPIALYELGAHAARNRAIAVGADPEYSRRRDVVEQLRHARPELTVWSTLEATVDAARRAPARGWAVRAVHSAGLGRWITSARRTQLAHSTQRMPRC